MENLKFNIYNTLIEKITIQAFEQWLYNEGEIMNNLESNMFIYEVITNNYQSKNCLENLKNIALKKYGDDFETIFVIEKSCMKIIQTKNIEAYYEILKKVMMYFNYEQEYKILWQFYDCYNHVELIYDFYWSEEDLRSEIQLLAKTTLVKLEKCASIQEKKAIVFEERKAISLENKYQKHYKKTKTFSLRKIIAQLRKIFVPES